MAMTIQTLDALTYKYFIKKMIDNFFLNSALLFKLRQNETPFDGGRDIRQPISYKKSPNAGAWGGGAGVLPTTFVDHATQAVFPIAYYYGSITVPWTEQLLNAGEAKIVDLLKAQTELVENSLRDTMGIDTYSDGSNNAGGFATLSGLKAILTYNADPAPASYGGITRSGANGSKASPSSGNDFWNANVGAANSTVTFWKGGTTLGTGTTLSLPMMQAMFGACTQGSEKPSLLVSSQQEYNAYQGLLTSVQRQMTDDEIGKAGFANLTYNGVPLVVDDSIDNVGKMYFLNLDHIFLRPHRKANFYATEFRQPPNQLMNIKYIVWMGNMTCDRPNLQGCITGLTG